MGIREIAGEMVDSWKLEFAVRKFRTKKEPELDNQTALAWLAGFLKGFEQGRPGLLREEIEKGTTFGDILPEDIKAHILQDKSWWSKFADHLTGDEAAKIVHTGLAEVNPPLAEICTIEWFAHSFEEYKRLKGVGRILA